MFNLDETILYFCGSQEVDFFEFPGLKRLYGTGKSPHEKYLEEIEALYGSTYGYGSYHEGLITNAMIDTYRNRLYFERDGRGSNACWDLATKQWVEDLTFSFTRKLAQSRNGEFVIGYRNIKY